ncbi:unnamed protein product [Oikopleura dioica]|uniref:Uncharacterized protein n=1 Tax=Oikopleura dioica TaxID=34765 RepID=E4YGW7_OIKDI|nr:unnamed protein product [Oikopleura dioica]
MSIAVTQHVQAKSALEIENNWVSGQFTSFVETSCNYFSSPEHRQILREWSNKAWNDEFRSSLSASLTICENTMTANEELMDLHYSSFTNFYCKMDSLSCGEDTIGSPSSFNSWYLPRNEMGESHYKPTQYYVDLSIRNLTEGAQEDGDFYYDGTSQVDLTSSVALDEIHIHVDREEFMKITGYVVRANGKVVPVRKTVHNSNRFLFSFYLDATIPADTQISLIMNYVVKLTTATEGLYLGHYEDEKTKETLYLLSTQFESTHARECFPCFDEPSLKAQYKFTIEFDKGVRQDYTAIYNMDIEKEIDLGNNRQKNVYYNSMPMATYLNAILVSPFNTESKEWKDDTIYALNEAMSIVDNFSIYFDWNYCHAFKNKTNNNAIGELVCKTDQTGIPQFRSGAMENWGLITYREYYLHYNSQRDTNLVRRTVTRIVGHELIHQWFGNLITCKWWDEIYINEAWGSIGGYLGLQQAESMNNVQYEWEDEYLTTQGYSGFTYDGRNTSRPMVNNANNGLLKVETPNEISRQFDSIAYNKAGSVMMMIREVIGEDLWQAGLRKYLKDNQYTSPTWREQLQAWDDVVPDFETNTDYGENDAYKPASLTEAFTPYFLQMGYPLLEISKYGNSGGQYTIKHSRFMSNNGELSQPESDYGYEWNVPLIFTDKLDKRYIKWIKTSCEGADTIIALAEDAVIDPNAKTWHRIKFSDDIISDYASNNRVKKRQAAKTVQDVYQMAISPRYKATVTYADAMKATKLLANFPAEKQNWIVYREMTDFNTFASRLVAATMDFGAGTGEAEFAEAFRSYMFGLVNNNAVHDSNNYQTTPDRCYPDEDGVGLPRDESKARMAPYVTQTQLYYASTDQSFFEQAKRLSDKLVDNSLPFLQQSADTRPDTFIGAVIKEEAALTDPINAANTPVINHFVNKLQLNNTDFKCSSTQLSYPLYSTEKNLNCELHRYWNALLSIRTQEGYYKLYDKLPVELQPVYTVEAAANKYLFRFIVNSFATIKEPIDVKNYLQTPRRLNSLVSNSCSYMTLQSDLDLQMAWKDELLDWTDESNVNIRETRDNCVSNILARSANFKNDYASVRNWLCADLNAAQPGSCDWSKDTIVFA